MKNLLLVSAASLLLLGCSTREMDTAASNTIRTVTYPVTAPIRAIGQSIPLASDTEYVYWRAIPGTNHFETYTSSKPLTAEEMEELGILQSPEPPVVDAK